MSATMINRRLTILGILPRHPRRIGVREIREQLSNRGIKVQVRTLQRDLVELSGRGGFPIEADGCNPQGWCWADGAVSIELPTMTQQTALTLHLFAEHGRALLPPSILDGLEPYFVRARRVLDGPHHAAPFAQWRIKVRIIHATPLRLPAPVNHAVLGAIYESLFNNRRFLGLYRPRDAEEPREYSVNPLGLVFKDGLAYLVATLREYLDIRQMALHRFLKAEMLEEPATAIPGFSLDGYIAQGAFGYPEGGPITIKLLLDPAVVRLLKETPLSEDQRLSPQKDGRTLLEATVKEGAELRWWILSFGPAMEVMAPERLRERLRQDVERMARHYGVGGTK